MRSTSAEATAGLGLLGLGAATIGLAGLALAGRGRAAAPAAGLSDRDVMLRAARQLNRGSGVLAFSVLADSAVEHYRGDYRNPGMLMPLLSGALGVAASLHGLRDETAASHRLRDAAQGLAVLTGAAGTGFHLYNIFKRPGGLSWNNLFYAAPVGAPMALALSGMLGVLAERTREGAGGTGLRIAGRGAGRVLGVATSLGLLATAAEAGLLHFRGAFHNPAMLLPVSLPPAAALVLARESLAPPGRGARRWSLRWMRLTGLLGVLGAALHALGVGRNMGGWRNWRQNVLAGPPLPAPPSFSALALAGVAALELIEEEERRHG